MSSRKFFSGNTLEQAVLAAARHFGIEPERVTYREIEKKHGFLRSRKRHVIQVDEPGSTAEEPAETAAETVAEPVEKVAETVAESAESVEEPLADPRPARQEEPPRQPPPASEPEWHSTHEAEPEQPEQPAEPVRDEPKEEPLTAAPGLPEVPSRWSKEAQPIGEPIAPPSESRSDAAGQTPADTSSPFVEEPAPPPSPPPEPRRAEPRERRRAKPERSRKEEGLTELPQAPVRARERLDQAAGERAEAARKAIEMLFELSAVELEAEVLQGDEGLEVEVWGNDQDLLFEDRGRLLLAYEHLLPRLIRGLTGRSIHCRVDSDSFHEIRAEQLRDLAQRVASKVHRHGRSETLEPMAPDERRIVHLTLADDPTVETQSRGRGLFKRVTVNPKRRGGGSDRRGPRY